MPLSPSARSIETMRDRGYWCQRVETWNPWAKRRIDLCGADILALKEGHPPTLVQSTTFSNRLARLKKLDELPSAKLWLATGGKLLVHGWRKPTKRNRKWELIEVEWPTTEEPR